MSPHLSPRNGESPGNQALDIRRSGPRLRCEVFVDAFFCGRSSDNVPKPRKRFDGVFGVVVVPWHPVVTQEREKFVAVFLEALFAFGGRFALENRKR